MEIVLLGLMFSPNSLEEAKLNSKIGISYAPHLFQKRLVGGLSACKDTEVSVINIPPVGSFPLHYKKILLHGEQWEKKHIEIGYVNVPVVKQIIQYMKVVRLLKERLRNGEKLQVMVYSLYEPYLYAVRKLKRRFDNLSVCLIQTDAVPGIDDMEKYMTAHAIRRGRRLVQLAKTVDKFVILTKYLTEPLQIGIRPYRIIECICEETQEVSTVNSNCAKICLYTGTVDAEFGIVDLACAFEKIPEAELWICGRGDAEETIKKIALQRSNIKYFGQVSQERVAELRNQCDFLMNPRRPTGTYTKYSFPSKTAEYMLSGKPLIMYKLEGIPDDYDQYLNYLTQEQTLKIVEELEQIFNKPYSELINKAINARNYMIREKNKIVQAQRIMELLKEE